jgi:hypothetical protein
MVAAAGYNSGIAVGRISPESRSLSMNRLIWMTVVGLAMTFVVLDRGAGDAFACPNCKEAVSLDAGETSNLSSGYNWSVVFMLTVPFSLLGTGAFMMRRAVKQGVLPEM